MISYEQLPPVTSSSSPLRSESSSIQQNETKGFHWLWTPTLSASFVFVYLLICISNVGTAPTRQSLPLNKVRPLILTCWKICLHQICFTKCLKLTNLSLPRPLCLCSRCRSATMLETGSSSAASVEKPLNTSITWRSIFAFTVVSPPYPPTQPHGPDWKLQFTLSWTHFPLQLNEWLTFKLKCQLTVRFTDSLIDSLTATS